MTTISISIEPRDQDREEAMWRILSEIIHAHEEHRRADILEMLVVREQIIMQAERLRDRVIDYVGREM